jgi:hypothetical protein
MIFSIFFQVEYFFHFAQTRAVRAKQAGSKREAL